MHVQRLLCHQRSTATTPRQGGKLPWFIDQNYNNELMQKQNYIMDEFGCTTVAYQPPSLGVVLQRGRGVRGSSPGNFFHLRWLNPLKFNSQAARFMPLSDRKTKGTITLKYCAVHKRFTPHSYWEVIRWAK